MGESLIKEEEDHTSNNDQTVQHPHFKKVRSKSTVELIEETESNSYKLPTIKRVQHSLWHLCFR